MASTLVRTTLNIKNGDSSYTSNAINLAADNQKLFALATTINGLQKTEAEKIIVRKQYLLTA